MDLVRRLVLKKENTKFPNCIYIRPQSKGSGFKGVDEIFETFLEWTRFEEIQKRNKNESPLHHAQNPLPVNQVNSMISFDLLDVQSSTGNWAWN
jgi:hypothetical protein